MSTRIRFLLPLPPSVNNQYRDADIGGVTRRVLSAEAKHWKTSIARAFHTLLVNGRLPDGILDDAQNGYVAIYGEFFFETPHRRDLDGGLKIAQDAVCAGLRVNDNRVVEIRLLKRVIESSRVSNSRFKYSQNGISTRASRCFASVSNATPNSTCVVP
jgi:crossover junction endodeoxyribonuclease RusA